MVQKVFWGVAVILLILTALSNPVVVQSFLNKTPTPTSTPIPPTFTPTPTATRDPFANIPIATPQTNGSALIAISVQELPAPLGDLPPTFTPTPEPQNVIELLPDPALVYRPASSPNFQRVSDMPSPLTGPAPDRIKIKKLDLDARIQPVGVMPVQVPSTTDAFVAPAIPSAAQAVGWLNISAPFGQIGNTVLLGSQQTKNAGFYGLWLLEAGDEIILFAEKESRTYTVIEAIALSEQEEPIETRRANARYTQFTADEQLTLVTGGPPGEGNAHRTVVIAYPH
jgi:hypothetical protein